MPDDNDHSSHNPQNKAAAAYGQNALKSTPNAREVEARALLKAVKMMEDLQHSFAERKPSSIEEVLKYNRHIWIMFYDTARENKDSLHSPELRSNIINLANFVFKRESDILAAPDAGKFDVLININREIAAGLMSSEG